MSLEKGVNRMGTVLGVALGGFLVFLIWNTDLYSRISFHYGLKYQEAHTHLYNTGELVNFNGQKIFRLTRVPNENAPSEFFCVTLPKIGTTSIITLFIFFLGCYGAKVVAKTVNWTIKGFRK